MLYCLRAKSFTAEASALNQIEATALESLGLIIEPVSKVKKSESADRKMAAATHAILQSYGRFRQFFQGLVPSKPRYFAIDLNPLAAALAVDPTTLIISSANKLPNDGVSRSVVINARSSRELRSEQLIGQVQGLILKVTIEEISKGEYFSTFRAFIEKFRREYSLGFLIELSHLKSTASHRRREMLEVVLPRVLPMANWSQAIIASHSRPPWTLLPKAGETKMYPRPDILLARKIGRKFPQVEFCDRAVIDEGFIPRRLDKAPQKRPPHLMLSLPDRYVAVRAREIGKYSADMRDLAKQILPIIHASKPAGRTFKRIGQVANNQVTVASPHERIILEISSHLESSINSLSEP